MKIGKDDGYHITYQGNDTRASTLCIDLDTKMIQTFLSLNAEGYVIPTFAALKFGQKFWFHKSNVGDDDDSSLKLSETTYYSKESMAICEIDVMEEAVYVEA